jgi:hypothetical protein
MRALRARISYVVCRMSEKEVRSKIRDSSGRFLAALRAKMERIRMKREGYIAEWMRGSFGRVLEGRANVKEKSSPANG